MRAMADLFFELGCEEIPARFLPELIADLQKKAQEKLTANGLRHGNVETFGTPRRLVLFVENIPAKQPDITEELKGPPAEIAFDKDGQPTQAAIGFAKKNNLDVNSLTTKTENNRKFVSATIVRKGVNTEKLLSTLLPEIISSLYLPISMKWGAEEFKFIRPIHWILALYGKKIIKFQLAGIKSSNTTYGHRFLTNIEYRISNADINIYKKLLLKKGVIADQDQRKEAVRKAVKKAAPSVLIDEELLSEVTNLVEMPYAIVCSFNPEFLALPKEVLITSMKKNQKYFPILDPKGKLTENFVVVTNGCKDKTVRNGNQKVISARLSDAKFFFDEDRAMPLRARVGDLKRVQFFEGLGDMEKKTIRLIKLSEFIAKQLKVDPKHHENIERVAGLCKADLLTKMVFEFPELQGVMGREYALISGEERAVADGIFEHYLPKHAEDALPKTIPGVIVSLADKIDTLVGCFGIGKIPTGSADPYGLRRAVTGVIRIIIENKLELPLDEIISFAMKEYLDILKDVPFEKVYKQLLEFIGGRLKGIMLDEGLAYDVIDASFANLSDIFFTYEIAHALQEYRKNGWFLGIVQTHDRISRISDKATRDEVIEQDLIEEIEKELFHLYLKINWDVEENINKGNYKLALESLAKLTEPVEQFFVKILVMHQDERIKTNRLALLKTLNSLFLKASDFRKIVV